MEDIKLPSEIKFIKDIKNKNRMQIIITPCYPGYGVTLGNALRRVLLSSLEGSAVTAVKIKGVEHEFSTIDFVKEDVVEIILNLKQLNLKVPGDKPVVLELKAKGEKKVKAKDITVKDGVEIINPDLLIATITDPRGKLEMEITVSRGRGYVPVEQREDEELSIGTIAVDSIFNPVVNVGFKIENVRVGKMTNYDKLIMDIETDGTITPKEALEYAAKILVDHFNIFQKKDVEQKKENKKEVSKNGISKNVSDLKLSTRTLNALKNAKIEKVSDLVKLDENKLLSLDGFGQNALKEVKHALKKLNLELKD